MLDARPALAVFVLAPLLAAGIVHPATAPSYSTASFVNAATNLPQFAPNTIVSIYGTNLSYNTGGLPQGTRVMPTTLGGVTVYFGNTAGNLFFVSPQQINVLVPYDLLPGPVNVRIVREGTAGPQIPITLSDTAPGLFQLDATTVIATHADGSLVNSSSPAAADEIVIVYAVGLGRTVPDMIAGTLATTALPILYFSNLQVLIAGSAIDPGLIQYAGITPGSAGLYQINIQLPSQLPLNPELRIALGSQMSPASLNLLTR